MQDRELERAHAGTEARLLQLSRWWNFDREWKLLSFPNCRVLLVECGQRLFCMIDQTSLLDFRVIQVEKFLHSAEAHRETLSFIGLLELIRDYAVNCVPWKVLRKRVPLANFIVGEFDRYFGG